MGAPGSKHANSSDIVRIYQKLEQVLRKVGDDLCTYLDRNITDATVAKELGVLPAAVARVRKENYGNLQLPHAGRGSPSAARLDELELKIEALEHVNQAQAKQIAEAAIADQRHVATITALQSAVTLFQEKYNALCTQISLNKVLDVRKLLFEIPIPLHPTANGQQTAQQQIYRR